MSWQFFRTWCPRITGIVICLAAVGAQLIPDAGAALQWERAGSGILTGHLAHWSWDHLVWDLGVFAALSIAVLRLLPGRYVVCLVISGILIPVEIIVNQPQFFSYRGLSGIDSALFGLLLAALWRRGAFPRVLAFVGGGAFVAKSVFELQTGGTLFVSSGEAEFIPAVSAHLIGFLCGLVSGIPWAKSGPRLRLTPKVPSRSSVLPLR